MSVVREIMAAGPGCAIANGVLNGFETVKVKLQLHNASKPVYHTPTMTGVMAQIIKEEGLVRGLVVPGLSASLTRSIIYGGYRVGLYSATRDWLSGSSSSNGGTVKMQHRIMSGMFTGALGSMLTCPLDMVRTRMQADAGLVRNGMYTTGLRKGKAVRYHDLTRAFVTILRDEGLTRGLFRGASVTVLRAACLNGAQLASYDTMKRTLGWQEGPVLHFVCAFCSGVIAQTVVMPIDTIKSAMMVGGTWQSVGRRIVTNGPFWFYRGCIPACAGQGLIMVLQMPLIEQFRMMLGVKAL